MEKIIMGFIYFFLFIFIFFLLNNMYFEENLSKEYNFELEKENIIKGEEDFNKIEINEISLKKIKISGEDFYEVKYVTNSNSELRIHSYNNIDNGEFYKMRNYKYNKKEDKKYLIAYSKVNNKNNLLSIENLYSVNFLSICLKKDYIKITIFALKYLSYK